MLTGKVLLTGGSGTLGRATLLKARKEAWPASFTVFARSESRLAKIKRAFPNVRCIVGDVRDRDSVERAIAGHDVVVHMAAMKRLPECEENAPECIQVNVFGTENVLRACAHQGVQECVVISTDKACRAATVYGASKLLTEGLMATYAKVYPQTRFHGVRYGNVLASNGSVVQLWDEQARRGEPLTITASGMRRFWMSPFDAVDLIDQSLLFGSGVICVPMMSALPILKMAQMLHPNRDIVEIGLRSNEKIAEDLLHPYEPVMKESERDLFLICTISEPRWSTGWSYTSMMAPDVEETVFRQMIQDANEVEQCLS